MIALLFVFIVGWLGVFNVSFDINTDKLTLVMLIELYFEVMVFLHRCLFKE